MACNELEGQLYYQVHTKQDYINIDIQHKYHR